MSAFRTVLMAVARGVLLLFAVVSLGVLRLSLRPGISA